MTRIRMTGLMVAIGAAVATCGGEPRQPDGRSVQQGIELDGCLRPGRSAGDYVLEHVTETPPATAPRGEDPIRTRALIPKGGRVRLAGDSATLQEHLGERIHIVGYIQDAGRNTLVTSGGTHPDAPDRGGASAEPTTVPPGSSLSNAMRPLIAVERITILAPACENARRPSQAREQ